MSRRKKMLLHCVVVAAAILLAYWKVLGAGFISWDDPDYVYNTRDIYSGLSFGNVYRWFSTIYLGNYQPLPVLTYVIDHEIAGTNPFVYHLHNVLWHIAAAVLVYIFTASLLPDLRMALFVALLFAVHPVQAESVSWISARNKSMNAVFYFAAMIFYVRYLKTGKISDLVLTNFAGVLAYLCKATALSLPFALIAVDIWRKVPFISWQAMKAKLFLLLAGIPVMLVTLYAQKQAGFLHHHEGFGLSNVVFAGYALTRYLFHLLVPVNLSVLYPYPESITPEHVLLCIPAVAFFLLIVITYYKGSRMWSAGLLFFLVNLLPVLQLVQFGETLMANRYLYIAGIGIWIPAVCYIFAMIKRKWRNLPAIVLTSICAVLLVLTIIENNIWHNEIVFWNSVVDKFPESTVAHYSLGAAYLKNGDVIKAEKHMNMSVVYDPGNYKAWRNKGSLHLSQGRITDAMYALNRSLQIYPYSKTYFTRALLYYSIQDYRHAIADVAKALSEEPGNARMHYLLGECDEQLGRFEEAAVEYSKAIASDDRESLYFVRRGLLFARHKNLVQALIDIERAIALNSSSGELYYYKAIIRYKLGQDPCGDLKKAMEHGYRKVGKMAASLCK